MELFQEAENDIENEFDNNIFSNVFVNKISRLLIVSGVLV